MAAAHPTPGDRGPMILGLVWSFHVLTLAVYIIRIRTRLTPKLALTAADYTITCSIILMTAALTFTTLAVHNGFGKHTADMPMWGIMKVGLQLFAVFMTGVPAACFARISIACLLLQITVPGSGSDSNVKWRVLIWATIALQAGFMLSYDGVQLSQCGGLIARTQGPDALGRQCLAPASVWVFNYVGIGIAIFSDLVCALIPICLIRKLSRSPVEKFLITVLLTLSLLAAVCGVPKLYYTVTYDFADPDGFYRMTLQFVWTRTEEALIVIAACAPLVRVPIERALQRWFGIESPFYPPAPARDLESAVFATGNVGGGGAMVEARGVRWPPSPSDGGSTISGSNSRPRVTLGEVEAAAGKGTRAVVDEEVGKEETVLIVEKTRRSLSATTSTAELLRPVSGSGSGGR